MDMICLADFGMPLDIDGIAHRLAHTPRFYGASEHQYSVAQHAIELSEMVPTRLERAALLKDVARTALGAGFSVLKTLSPEIHALERKLTAEVMGHFNVAWSDAIEAELCAFERMLLATVVRDLTPDTTLGLPSLEGVEPRLAALEIVPASSAERCYRSVWRLLHAQHQARLSIVA